MSEGTPPPNNNKPPAEGTSTTEDIPAIVVRSPPPVLSADLRQDSHQSSDANDEDRQPNKRRRLNSPSMASPSNTIPFTTTVSPSPQAYPPLDPATSFGISDIIPVPRPTALFIDNHASDFASLLAQTEEDERREKEAAAEAEAEAAARKETADDEQDLTRISRKAETSGASVGDGDRSTTAVEVNPEGAVEPGAAAAEDKLADDASALEAKRPDDNVGEEIVEGTAPKQLRDPSGDDAGVHTPVSTEGMIVDVQDINEGVQPDIAPAPFNIDDLDHAQLELFVAQFAESQRQAAEAEEQAKLQEEGLMDEDDGTQAQTDIRPDEPATDAGVVDMIVDEAEVSNAEARNVEPQTLTDRVEPSADVGEESEETSNRMDIDPSLSTAGLSKGAEGGKAKGKEVEKRVAFAEPDRGDEPSRSVANSSFGSKSSAARSGQAMSSSVPPSADLQSAATAALSALDPNAQASILAALQQLSGGMALGGMTKRKGQDVIDLTAKDGTTATASGSNATRNQVESRPSIGGASAIVHGDQSASAIAVAAQKASAANAEAASNAQPDISLDDADVLPEGPVTLDSAYETTMQPLQAQPISTTSAMRPINTIRRSGGPLSPANRGNSPTRTASLSPPPPRVNKGKSKATYTMNESDEDELLATATAGEETDGEGILGETAKERRERRRSRLVLSCTECHRRKQQCDRNVPCSRCVKRGVAHLCHMDIAASRTGKRKRESEAPETNASTELLARISALESLLRAQSQQSHLAQGYAPLPYGPPYSGIGLGGRSALPPSYFPAPRPLGFAPAIPMRSTLPDPIPMPAATSLNTDGDDDVGAANINAGLAALVAATAEAERNAEANGTTEQTAETMEQSGEAADLLAQIAQSLQKVQPMAQPEPSSAEATAEPAPPADSQGGLLMSVLSQLTGSNRGQPASFLNSLLASIPHQPKIPGVWADISSALPETGVQLQLAYASDPARAKLNLGMTGFREDDGRIFIPPTTRQMERALFARGGLSHEPLPVEGYVPFLQYGLRYSYGIDSPCFKQGRIAAVQTVSLTGALRLGATFLSRHPSHPPLKAIYIPTPTAEEDAWALKDAGLDIRLYRFYDKKTGLVDWEGMRDDLLDAPDSSIMLLHVGGSSPTGAEMTAQQWRLFTEMVKHKRHIIFAVLEFQGLATGDPARDAQPLRLLAHEDVPLITAQSFDCSMGLYSDSPTILSVVANSLDAKYRIESQLRSMSRAMHAHPTPWGANIAAGILANPDICKNWLSEVKAMSERLRSIREKLFDQLTYKLKTPGNWHHVRRSAGMFSSVVLTAKQLEILANREHVHLLPDGCFSLGCLNAVKIEAFCQAIDNVVRYPDGVPIPEPEAEAEEGPMPDPPAEATAGEVNSDVDELATDPGDDVNDTGAGNVVDDAESAEPPTIGQTSEAGSGSVPSALATAAGQGVSSPPTVDSNPPSSLSQMSLDAESNTIAAAPAGVPAVPNPPVVPDADIPAMELRTGTDSETFKEQETKKYADAMAVDEDQDAGDTGEKAADEPVTAKDTDTIAISEKRATSDPAAENLFESTEITTERSADKARTEAERNDTAGEASVAKISSTEAEVQPPAEEPSEVPAATTEDVDVEMEDVNAEKDEQRKESLSTVAETEI